MHVHEHMPVVHVAVALARVEHGVMQLPQAAVSVCVSTHIDPHCVIPLEQEPEHMPIEHTCEDEHTLPQLPQLFGSFCMSEHAVPASPEQRELPVGHAHIDCRHVVPMVHLVPHVPQLSLSVARLTHELPHALGVEPAQDGPPPASLPASGVGATPESCFTATCACSPPAHAAATEMSAIADQAPRVPKPKAPIRKNLPYCWNCAAPFSTYGGSVNRRSG